MKRVLVLILAIVITLGAATVFSVADSRAVVVPKPEPICRIMSPNEQKCLLWMHPGNLFSDQRLETIRKNIYWKEGRLSAMISTVIEKRLRP